MNYIRHLTAFYTRAVDEERLSPTHMSMYMALFQLWNLNRFRNPVSITRGEVMRVSKINAVATYHKCIKDLDALGYIIYSPSYNPFKGSLITMLEFSSATPSKNSRQKDSCRSVSAPDFDHLNEPSINSINNTNIKTESIAPHQNLSRDKIIFPDGTIEAKSSAKKQKPDLRPGENIPPPLAELELYFKEKEISLSEAEKFINHYEANGWLIGGKSKMKNWQAAARNWILNTKKFNPQSNGSAPSGNHLHATTNKSYQDKL